MGMEPIASRATAILLTFGCTRPSIAKVGLAPRAVGRATGSEAPSLRAEAACIRHAHDFAELPIGRAGSEQQSMALRGAAERPVLATARKAAIVPLERLRGRPIYAKI